MLIFGGKYMFNFIFFLILMSVSCVWLEALHAKDFSERIFAKYQSEMIFYKNTQVPLVGTNTQDWQWPGLALTANTSRFSADLLQDAKIVAVRWVLVWNPKMIDSEKFSAVRLVNFDNGPTNIVEIAVIKSKVDKNYSTPRVDVIDVTKEFKLLLENRVTKQIGHQTMSTTGTSVWIYGSWLEIIWG